MLNLFSAHITKDLDAYVCLFDECDRPEEMYRNSSDWWHHMRLHKLRWRCGSKSHGMQTFLTEDQYLRHMRQVHKGSLTEPQLRALAERNPRPIEPMFEVCPMCGAAKPGNTMAAHIVGHMRLLAVRSLPPFEDVDAESCDESGSGASRASSRSAIKDDPDRDITPVFEDVGADRTWHFNTADSSSPFAPWGGYRNYIAAIPKGGDHPQRRSTLHELHFSLPEIFDADKLLSTTANEFPDDPSSSFIEAPLFDDISTKDRRSYEWGFVPEPEEDKHDHVLTSMLKHKANVTRSDQVEQPKAEYKKPYQTAQSSRQYKKPYETVQSNAEYEEPYQTVRVRRPSTSPDSRECRVAECDRRHVYDKISGVRIYSRYCQEHTCHAPRNEHVIFCINPREPTNRYCAFHGKCRRLGCTTIATRSEKEPFPYICPRHRCSVQHCGQPKFGNLNTCEIHRVCGISECSSHPQAGQRFCDGHSCKMVTNCALPALHPGVGFCSIHIPCGLVRGCRRLRMRFGDEQLIHCDLHIPCVKSRDGCRQTVVPGSDFCLTHKCDIRTCINPKEASLDYCNHHAC